MTDQRFNRLLLTGVLVGTVLIISFLTALSFAKAGEIATALGSVLGGIIGAGGAAAAVYLTLSGQREEDRSRIKGALVREVIEFARLVVGHLNTCEHIRSRVVSLPLSRLAEVFEMPWPTIYPAVADRIGLLVRPQRYVAFFARIKEIGVMARAISRGPLAESAIADGGQIQIIAEAWVDIAQFALWIIQEAPTDDPFDEAVRASVLADLEEQIVATRTNFQLSV